MNSMIVRSFSKCRRVVHLAIKWHELLSLHMLAKTKPEWFKLTKKQRSRILRYFAKKGRILRETNRLRDEVRSFIPRAICISRWDETLPHTEDANLFVVTDGKLSFKEEDTVGKRSRSEIVAWQSALDQLKSH